MNKFDETKNIKVKPIKNEIKKKGLNFSTLNDFAFIDDRILYFFLIKLLIF